MSNRGKLNPHNEQIKANRQQQDALCCCPKHAGRNVCPDCPEHGFPESAMSREARIAVDLDEMALDLAIESAGLGEWGWAQVSDPW